MNRLLSKLNILLMPCVEAECYRMGPLPGEIQASADLMLWFADELPASRLLFADELVAQHRNWPNVHDWQVFVKAIEGLSVDEAESKRVLTLRVPFEAFEQARAKLLSECRLMLKEAPGAGAPSKTSRTLFLPNDSQRRVYREHVLQYYQEYIVGKNLKHKELMVHWAAVYQAIADRSGLREVTFCGPEFDAFLFDYCGIAYNTSTSRRGRYRTIQDLRTACLDTRAECAQRQDFNIYRSNMNRIIGSQQRVVKSHGSDVPRKLPE